MATLPVKQKSCYIPQSKAYTGLEQLEMKVALKKDSAYRHIEH
jgi:hypothetical protein